MRALALALTLFGTLLRPEAAQAADDAGALRVEGTRFVMTAADGGVLQGADLVGAELDLGEIGVVRVVAVERDAGARFDEIWMHTLELRQPGSMLFSNFCAPDTKGDKRVVVYPGYFDEQNRYIADAGRFSMSCASGVESKCLRWGYLPWRRAPNTGESLVPYFESCIHLARADYCGDNRPSTLNGTSIDIFDRVGVQQQTLGYPELVFEAGWNTGGAVCVRRTRIPKNLALDELPDQCARFTAQNTGESCTELAASQRGALLFNRSRIQTAP
jgi:hypothetical protein